MQVLNILSNGSVCFPKQFKTKNTVNDVNHCAHNLPHNILNTMYHNQKWIDLFLPVANSKGFPIVCSHPEHPSSFLMTNKEMTYTGLPRQKR